jgi:RimJ/RimL family protein N-acetyltransferase
MTLAILPKSHLSESQARWIDERLSAQEHANDCGPPKVWSTYQQGLYAVIDLELNRPVGLVEASGPTDCISPGWWLDSTVRGKGYGNQLVDALAAYLKAQGYTGVGNILIQTKDGNYDQASSALKKRFLSQFNIANHG